MTQTLPVLPLRDIVVFPHMVVPLFVGREKSIKALEEVMRADKQIFLLTQRDSATDDPGAEDLFEHGCVAKIMQLLKLPDGTVRVLVEGQERARTTELTERDGYMEGTLEALPTAFDKAQSRALATEVREAFADFGKVNNRIAEEVVASVVDTLADAQRMCERTL
ncbi:MAG: LON peptidase substrate-binding domain-containing protein, partial [Pseudomonadota bacterium]